MDKLEFFSSKWGMEGEKGRSTKLEVNFFQVNGEWRGKKEGRQS